MVKNLPAMQKTRVCSMGQEDPLEKENWLPTLVFHGQRSLADYSPWAGKEFDMTEQLTFSLS